jgi:hypothetical protein
VPEPSPFSRPILTGGVALGVLVAAAFCGAVAAQVWVIGSVEGRWTYNYVRPAGWQAILIACLSMVAAGGILLFPTRNRQQVRAVLLASVVAATAAHWAMRATAPYDLETLFLSPGANSFYTFAQQVEPGDLLAKFDRVRRQAPLHARSNMPGKTLLTHALEAVSARTDVLPWLLVALSNLGALLIYGLARELYGDERAALHAAVLYLFTPGRVFFFPIMNAVTPVFVLAFTWVIVRWLRSSSTVDAAAAGVLLYALVVFEPLPLVMGLLCVALAVAAVVRGQLRLDTFLIQAAAIAAFFVLTAVVVFEATGFHLLRAFRQLGADAVAFNEVEGRAYAVWVRANLVEFVFAAGPAQVLIAIAVPVAAWQARSSLAWLAIPAVATSVGMLAVVLVTDLIGINRGEVTRLWIFVACFFQLPAAWACAQFRGPGAILAVLAVTVLQAALGTATIGFVVP